MTNECPQCQAPLPRHGKRFCNQCGADLRSYYEARGLPVPPTSTEFPAVDKTVSEPPPGNRGGAAPADARPPALLHVLTREGEVFERELDGDEVKVGKGTDNDLILADPAVSARHAVIRADGGGYAIADLGSRNGTFVNDAPVTEPRRLGHGDVIKIGRSTLTFRLAQANETMIIARAEAAIKTPNPQPRPPLTEEALAAAVLAARLASTADVGRLRGPEASGRRLALALVEEKLVSEATLRDLMSRTFHLPTADLRGAEIDPAISAKLSPQQMREGHIIPVAVKPDHLTLAVADPTDTAVIEQVKAAFGLPVIVELASPGDIAAQIERTFAPRLIGLLPSGEKMEALVDQPEIGIGTATHNRVVVSHPTVSRTHAVILARDGGYSIVDLGSSNGTFVNGEQMGPSARTLQHGDKIQVGQVMLTFRNPTETTENKTARLSTEALEEVRRRAGTGAPAASRAAIVTPVATSLKGTALDVEPDGGEDKKKKKKKKEKEDDRIRAAYVNSVGRTIAQVVGAIVTGVISLGGAYYLVRSNMPSQTTGSRDVGRSAATAKLSAPTAATPISGGPFEASGVVQVPNSNFVLFVNDSRPGEVFQMEINAAGRQVGAVKAIPLGAEVDNPEAITYGGGYFYVVGSQAKPAAGARNALLRVAYDPAKQVAGQAEAIPDLRSLLLREVPALRGEGEKPGIEGGLNVEGLAWDPVNEQLLLGLRSPVPDSQCLTHPAQASQPERAVRRRQPRGRAAPDPPPSRRPRRARRPVRRPAEGLSDHLRHAGPAAQGRLQALGVERQCRRLGPGDRGAGGGFPRQQDEARGRGARHARRQGICLHRRRRQQISETRLRPVTFAPPAPKQMPRTSALKGERIMSSTTFPLVAFPRGHRPRRDLCCADHRFRFRPPAEEGQEEGQGRGDGDRRRR